MASREPLFLWSLEKCRLRTPFNWKIQTVPADVARRMWPSARGTAGFGLFGGSATDHEAPTIDGDEDGPGDGDRQEYGHEDIIEDLIMEGIEEDGDRSHNKDGYRVGISDNAEGW